jgi:hypothetical protein
VRIPLDYYRILGLPLAASEEQLRQAHGDRRQQLPRREYSQAAINSRKQLIEEAYVVLSDPKERRAYDQLYLAHAYGSEGNRNAAVALENRTGDRYDVLESHNLSIDINQDELVGALLILQELGEYELVLKLGHPYLVNNSSTAVKAGNFLERDEFGELAPEKADIVLTVALACLELGREEWQQGHYDNAAASLETGDGLLAKHSLFPHIRAEIQSDLCRLRPYRILELLALPEEKAAERRQGLQLLQEVLDERGGIDGTGDDQSGLNIDDFLRFIQQLRNYLTVAEQHKLFEAESQRPSGVATYLAVYALVARGFTQRQPALIHQAKQMLMRLSKRQDVHLEQSLCALLLGQTEEASRALELSQEYQALAFIRENSRNSPDWLPGLCLYGERWLQSEVFPNFRDLENQRASLKDYFADQRVQAYLEQLPLSAETPEEGATINRQSYSHTQTNPQNRHSDPSVVYRQFPNNRANVGKVPEAPSYNRSEYSQYSPSQFPPSPPTSTTEDTQVETPVARFPSAERIGRINSHYVSNPAKTPVPSRPQTQRRRKYSPGASHGGRTWEQRPITTRRRRSVTRNLKVKRLLWIVLAAVASILALLLMISTTVRWLNNLFSPAPVLKGKPLVVQLNEPPVPIPDRDSQPHFSEGPLTATTAEEIVQTWLATKAAALGQNHEIDDLENILADSALAQWQLIAQEEKKNNRYRKYEHSIKVERLDANPTDNNTAAVEASVTEAADFYENGQINRQKSYNETVRVRYNLIRQYGEWRIREMSVVNKVS